MSVQVNIIADYREVSSTIPERLDQLGANVEKQQLSIGDYLINNEIIVERKTRDDFALSIIQGRIFNQCAKMKNTDKHLVILVEGNPYHTQHNIDRQAVKGALTSISISWQIPIIFSANKEDTASTILLIAKQILKENYVGFHKAKRTKVYKNKAVLFLQGLPTIGPVLAHAILQKFKTIENVMLATEDELLEINGLGKEKVDKIRSFLSRTIPC